MSGDAVRAAFRRQAEACRALGSPLTARLCDHLAEVLQLDQGALARRVLGWTGDPGPAADSLPLRLCGGLHGLALAGRAPELRAAYARGEVGADLLLEVLARHEDELLGWLDNPPQTNEVARSAAIIAAARFAQALAPLPIRALELGASAGLNLNFHRYHLAPQGVQEGAQKGALPPSGARAPDSPGIFGPGEKPGRVVLAPEWRGEVPGGRLEVAEAEGVDLRPVDPVADALRLTAYCWADQEARLERLRGALGIARRHRPKVAAGDAAAWLAARLAEPAAGRLGFVFHTVAWQYFPAATQAACDAAIRRAGARASAAAPLAHFSMEADGGQGAALRLRLWDGKERCWSLGRADFHGRWIDWAPEQL